MRVLSAAAGLRRVFRLPFRSPGHRFPVCDVDVADVRLDAETTRQLIDGRLELIFAGCSDRHYATGAALHSQRWIVAHQLRQRESELLSIRVSLRIDAEPE
jgi:hypothetical protein